MPIPFKELGGSPVELYGPDGFQARREFLIAWQDRDAFAVELLGAAAAHGASAWVHYPGKSSVFAATLRYEPFDPDNPDPKLLASLTDGLNGYSSSFAKATVEYRTINPRDRSDGPENEIGTHLTYRMVYGVDLCQMTPGGWTWVDRPSIPAPDDVPLLKTVPWTDHHLTWHQVIHPPWGALRESQGKLNAAEFLGGPQGTVLFLGAEASKLFRSGFSAEESGFCWQIHYVFRERSVKQGGRSFGFNHAYRADPPGWAELTNGTDRMYDLADFSTLFQSTP